MTRAVVLGATGFIGQHLTRMLLATGHEVTAVARNPAGSPTLSVMGARLVKGDMNDLDTLREPIAGADVVYHLASMLKVPWRDDFVSSNVEGTTHIARACAEAPKAPVLVVVSSLAAGGPSVDGALRNERDGAQPVSRYGTMKRDCELAAISYAHRVPITIVRPPMVFGEGDRSALPLFKAVASGWHALPVKASNRVSMIHAADLAQALLLAADKGERIEPASNEGYGVYYAADAQCPTWTELGVILASALSKPPPKMLPVPRWMSFTAAAVSEGIARMKNQPTVISLDKRKEGMAGSWVCDPSKLVKSLGFAPRAALRERLRQTGAWYRTEGLIRPD